MGIWTIISLAFGLIVGQFSATNPLVGKIESTETSTGFDFVGFSKEVLVESDTTRIIFSILCLIILLAAIAAIVVTALHFLSVIKTPDITPIAVIAGLILCSLIYMVIGIIGAMLPESIDTAVMKVSYYTLAFIPFIVSLLIGGGAIAFTQLRKDK